MGEWMYRSMYSRLRHYLEVSGQFHVPAALPPEKNSPVPIGQCAGWASEPGWTTWRGEKILTLSGLELRPLGCQSRSQSLYQNAKIKIKKTMICLSPIIVAALSKAWTVFWRWDPVFESHSRYGCLCMRLFCVCVVLCIGRGRASGSSLVQGVLPSV
jgi:hypothetical protein